MGNKKNNEKFRAFAIAFLKEAKEDIEVAEELIDSGRYARCVSSSQQGVEKSVKALLEMENIFVKEHNLSGLFVKLIYNNEEYDSFKEELNIILDGLDLFEGEWSRTRYPQERKGKIEIPTEIYGSEDASTAYRKANEIYNIIKEILIKKFDLREKND